ncbi:MAG: PAS domain S-box protein [Gemmataceae bacterium]
MPSRSLKLLIIEDSADDFELMLVELRRAGFAPSARRIEAEPDFRAQLSGELDVILADFTMPQFGTLRALELLRDSGLDVPLIVVTGTVSEEVAVECIKKGAVDYLLKDRLSRLGKAVEVALEGRRLRAEKAQTELALRTTSIRRQAVLDASLDAIITIDHHGAILEFNPAAERIFGMPRDQVLGRQVDDLFVPPAARERHRNGLAEYLASGESDFLGKRHEVNASRADGSLFPVELTVVPVRLARTTNPLFIGFIRDISERRRTESALGESEARNRALLNTIPDQLLVVNRKGVIVESRHRHDRLLPDAEPGKPLAPLLPIECAPDLEDCLSRPADDTGVCVLEFTLDEPRRHVEVRVVGLDPSHVVVLIRDITQRKQDEEERSRLELRQQQARKLESLETLAGGVAHQFNNLLTVVLGHASLILNEAPADTPLHHAVKQIESAALRAGDLTKLMLACSGRARRTLRPVNLSQLVEALVPGLQQMIDGKARLELHLERELPSTLADTDQLRQLLVNLVSNAVEASTGPACTLRLRTGKITLDDAALAALAVRHHLRPGNCVFLEVADTGQGIDPANLSRIFDPFFTTRFPGRGLGLATVLGIVRGHSGAVDVSSEPGLGATFRVYFPLSVPGGRPPHS